MANEILEQMSDDELELVAGGTGAECINMLQQISMEGLADVKTSLVFGNEKEAAKELRNILKDYGFHGRIFYGDGDNRSNIYTYEGKKVSMDEAIKIMKRIDKSRNKK